MTCRQCWGLTGCYCWVGVHPDELRPLLPLVAPRPPLPCTTFVYDTRTDKLMVEASVKAGVESGGGIHLVTDAGLMTFPGKEAAAVEAAAALAAAAVPEEVRLEVEVFRIGGVELDGLPRHFGPRVERVRVATGWHYEIVVDDPSGAFSLRVTLDGMLAGPHAGFRKGTLWLEDVNGTRFGNAERFVFCTLPSAYPVHSLVPAVLIYDGRRVEVGMFSVALRVPEANEYRQPSTREWAAAGS